jgi:hypothetical protein
LALSDLESTHWVKRKREKKEGEKKAEEEGKEKKRKEKTRPNNSGSGIVVMKQISCGFVEP